MTTKLPPNAGALTDDRVTAQFPVIGPGPGSIIGDLVARSGDPQAGTLVPRYGAEGLCPDCQQLLLNRVPGVHPDVDSGAARNYRPASDGPGQSQMDIIGDPELDSGRAEAEFNAHAARHREGQWPRPTTLIDRNAVRNGYGPGVVRVDY
jgi:hypothetical protein